MKGLGYRQVGAFLENEYGYVEMVRLFKRDTRRFAKRQLTWFRKEPGIVWLSIADGERPDQTAENVIRQMEQFMRILEQQALSSVRDGAAYGKGSV